VPGPVEYISWSLCEAAALPATLRIVGTSNVIPVMGGSVSIDARRSVERTCVFTIADEDGNAAAALLDPSAEVAIEKNGTALGVFGTLDVDVSSDGTLSVSGSDRSARVSAQPFAQPFVSRVPLTVANYLDVVAHILIFECGVPAEQVGWWTGTESYQEGYLSAVTGDPWAACRDFALLAGGFRIFFDEDGIVRTERWNDVGGGAAATYSLSDDSVVSDITVGATLSGVYNEVVVQYEDIATGVSSRLTVGGYSSPLQRLLYSATAPLNASGAQDIGEQLLIESRGRRYTVGWTQVCSTRLPVNSIVDVSAYCPVGKVRVDSVTIPLDATSLMSVNGGRERGVSAEDLASVAATLKRAFTTPIEPDKIVDTGLNQYPTATTDDSSTDDSSTPPPEPTVLVDDPDTGRQWVPVSDLGGGGVRGTVVSYDANALTAVVQPEGTTQEGDRLTFAVSLEVEHIGALAQGDTVWCLGTGES
jgi:hypothetical protein